MNDIVKSIKAFLYDRTVSPLFGAYITAWSFWNFKLFIIVLDSKILLDEKLKLIDSHFAIEISGYTYNHLGQLVHGFLIPSVLTWLYLYVYPLVANPVYEHNLKTQTKLRELKQRDESLRLLTIEESRNLIKEIEQIRFKSDEDEKKYRERIASLTKTINSLEENNQPQSRESSEPVAFGATIKSIDDSQNKSTNAPSDKDNRLTVATSKFENMLLERFSVNGISSIGYFSEKERADLLLKIAKYCVENNISEDMFEILLAIIKAGGEIFPNDLKANSKEKFSSIEIEHIFKLLKDNGLIVWPGNGKWKLSDRGNAMAVESGLTLLNKKLNN